MPNGQVQTRNGTHIWCCRCNTWRFSSKLAQYHRVPEKCPVCKDPNYNSPRKKKRRSS